MPAIFQNRPVNCSVVECLVFITLLVFPVIRISCYSYCLLFVFPVIRIPCYSYFLLFVLPVIRIPCYSYSLLFVFPLLFPILLLVVSFLMYLVRNTLLRNYWQWRVNRRVRSSRKEIKLLLNVLPVVWLYMFLFCLWCYCIRSRISHHGV